MTFALFKQSLADAAPPADLTPALLALWHDGRGEWAEAHRVAQDVDNPSGAWVHAYLHRKEGDVSNAGYWYRRAGHRLITGSLEDEWASIVTALLTETPGA